MVSINTFFEKRIYKFFKTFENLTFTLYGIRNCGINGLFGIHRYNKRLFDARPYVLLSFKIRMPGILSMYMYYLMK